MPAYIVADIAWSDPDKIQEYSRLAYPTLVAAGGKMLAATSEPAILEGSWHPGILVLIEFPSAEAAQKWLDSPEYQPAKELRYEHAKSKILLV